MSRLSDTQLVILSSASRRHDRGVDLPANVTDEAVRKAVDKLIRAGLLEEVRADGSLLAWRREVEAGPVALRITKQGLEAIAVEDAAVPLPRRHPFVRLLPLRSKRLQPRPSPLASGFPLRPRSPGRSISRARLRRKLARRGKAGRARSKRACSRCWAERRERRLQPSCAPLIGSSTRSAASSLGVVRKKLGLNLRSEKVDGNRVYRIVRSSGAGSDSRPSRRRAA
jgi:hypothetical protein